MAQMTQEQWEAFDREETTIRNQGRDIERRRRAAGSEWYDARRLGEHYLAGTPQRERYDKAQAAFDAVIAEEKANRKAWQSLNRRKAKFSRWV